MNFDGWNLWEGKYARPCVSTDINPIRLPPSLWWDIPDLCTFQTLYFQLNPLRLPLRLCGFARNRFAHCLNHGLNGLPGLHRFLTGTNYLDIAPLRTWREILSSIRSPPGDVFCGNTNEVMNTASAPSA